MYVYCVFYFRGGRYPYNVITTTILSFNSIKKVDITGKFTFRFQINAIILLDKIISFIFIDYYTKYIYIVQ
jgi:hypothetical protein